MGDELVKVSVGNWDRVVRFGGDGESDLGVVFRAAETAAGTMVDLRMFGPASEDPPVLGWHPEKLPKIVPAYLVEFAAQSVPQGFALIPNGR